LKESFQGGGIWNEEPKREEIIFYKCGPNHMAKYGMAHLSPRGTDNWPHSLGRENPLTMEHLLWRKMRKSFINMQSSGSESAPSEHVGIKSHIVRELVTDEVEHVLAPGAQPAWIVESGGLKRFTGVF
jgi:hypothetical protein